MNVIFVTLIEALKCSPMASLRYFHDKSHSGFTINPIFMVLKTSDDLLNLVSSKQLLNENIK